MMNFKMRRSIKRAVGQLAVSTSLIVGILPTTVNALALSDLPLFLVDSVPPNLVLTMDDSGSMGWGYIPDSIQYKSALNAAKSSHYNKMYYDPTRKYLPPLKADGAPLPAADFDDAKNDPYGDGDDEVPHNSSRVNLATSFRPLWRLVNPNGSRPAYAGGSERAYYYNYVAGNSGCDGDSETDACYQKVVVGADEEQNFANWYQYYSYRAKTAKAAISFAFAPEQLPSSMRVGRQTINRRGVKSGDNNSTFSYVNAFGAAERENFYDWLFNVDANGGTPLRRAQITVGDYFTSSGVNSPYVIDPGGSSPENNEELSCRLNTHIMVTDGVYNQSHDSPGGETPFRHDYDSFTLPNQRAYDSNSPETAIYADDEIINSHITGSNKTPLSDFAFHYWATDLRPDLDNNVKPYLPAGSSTASNISNADFWNPANDPATWQHLVNYTVGFGVAGHVPLTQSVYTSLREDQPFTNNSGATQTGWKPISYYDESQRSDDLARTDDLYHAAVNSRGQFFAASSPDDLSNAITQIVNSLSARLSSASSVDLNSSSIAGGVGLYQAKFQTDTWEGNILARPISDGSGEGDSCNDLPIGTVCEAVWDAGAKNTKTSLNWDQRKIFTYAPANDLGTRGRRFRWASNAIGDDKISVLNNGDSTSLSGSTLPSGQARLQYIRGNGDQEQQNGGVFRNRSETRLGAIVHSSPTYVGNGFEASGAFDILYPDDLEGNGSQTHREFLEGTFNRTPMLYVGANDGMLHAYDARIGASNGGKESFAYIPDLVFDQLWKLAEPTFVSGSYVDGELTHGDAFYESEWHTLLLGGVRTGGQGYFALDITNPDNIISESDTVAEPLVRWEFGDTNTASDIAEGATGANGDRDMGFSFSKAVITKVNYAGTDVSSLNPSSTGRWVAIFGNGYNATHGDGAASTSTTGDAALYVVDVETGLLLKKFNTGVGTAAAPNGMSSPAAVFNDDDLTTDYVYAGDLYGNLWKFDISSTDLAEWKIAYSDASGPLPLFKAETANGVAQPIQSTPRVGTHPTRRGGNMVYFGTGQYLETADNVTTALQAFYGIWDKDLCGGSDCASLPIGTTQSPRNHDYQTDLTVNNLLKQSIAQQANGKRVTTDLPIKWEDDPETGGNEASLGWYLQLATGSGSNPVLTGERMVGRSVLRGRTIVFTTVIPSDNPCEAGGTSWLMALDRSDGGLAPSQPFDHDGDGVLDSNDYLNDSKTSGIQGELSGDGVYSDPTVIRCGSGDCYYIGTSEGEVKSGFSGEGFSQGRRRWRQLN